MNRMNHEPVVPDVIPDGSMYDSHANSLFDPHADSVNMPISLGTRIDRIGTSVNDIKDAWAHSHVSELAA